MSSTMAYLDLASPGMAESRAVKVLADIVSVKASMGTFNRDQATLDEMAARDHDSSFGLSPEFERWERCLQSLTGAWWELDDRGFFIVHY